MYFHRVETARTTPQAAVAGGREMLNPKPSRLKTRRERVAGVAVQTLTGSKTGKSQILYAKDNSAKYKPLALNL